MDMQVYWAGVFQTERSLPADASVWITSCDRIKENGGKEGVTVATSRRQAAIRIFDRMFRLATPEEIEAAKRDLERLTAEDVARERMRNANTKLQLTPELLAAVNSPKRK